MQSHEWERLQEILGRKSWRIEGHLIIRHNLPGGLNYLYAPRVTELTDEFLHKIKAIAAKEKSLFLKVDPIDVRCLAVNVRGLEFSHCLQPRKTVVLDLTKSEDELLSAMHPKTRYNIRLAERKGVHILKCPHMHHKAFLDAFWEMLQETARRDIFHLHPKAYYEKLLGLHTSTFSNVLFLAEHRGTYLAGALVNYHMKRATYLHGASAGIGREKMAPHLLHWRIIQDAKAHGMTGYDLWGIDEEKWPGVTRFKMGFGGTVVEYPQSFDIIFRPAWYKIYRLARRIK